MFRDQVLTSYDGRSHASANSNSNSRASASVNARVGIGIGIGDPVGSLTWPGAHQGRASATRPLLPIVQTRYLDEAPDRVGDSQRGPQPICPTPGS